MGLGKPRVQVWIELSHSQAVTLVFALSRDGLPDSAGPIRDCSRLTSKPEVIPLRRESAPVHLILRLNILGALGDT